MIVSRRESNVLIKIALTLLISSTEVTFCEARIFVAPESVNTTLNTTAVFCCTVTRELFQWVINGNGETSPKSKARGVDVTSPVDLEHGTINSTLTIPAAMDNDNITISCEVASGNVVITSPVVLLRVQGLLDSVPNLEIDRTDDYHILTWDPPPTLDITDVDPDIIAYTVCDNVTSSCQNTSDTRYVFPTLCDPVEFTVSAWNPVGEGERVNIVYEPPDDVRRLTTIRSIESEVSFMSLSKPVVTLLLQVDGSGNCFQKYNTEFRGNCSGVSKFLNLTPTVDENGTVNLTFLENITADDFYTVTVTVLQEVETTTLTMKEANLTTFDVQENAIRKGSGTLNVTCVFASGSQAKGCFIVIWLVRDGPSYSNNTEARRIKLDSGELQRNASVSFTDLESGSYNVLMFDVGVNGEYNLDKSLYNELIEIEKLSQTIELIPTIAFTSAFTVISTLMGSSSYSSAEISSTVSQAIISGISAGAFVTLIISTVIIITGVYMKVRAKEASNTAVKNDPIYEEIELPVKGSPNLSSVNQIAMQANSAYEGVEMRPPTSRNANQMEPCPAYGVVTGQH